MGAGSYSMHSRMTRSKDLGYMSKSREEIFTQRKIKNEMDPSGVQLRESRDSDEHPNSVPIILALDVTGSMGNIPHQLVKEGLPTIMSSIIQNGIRDPQLLFLGIGDHETDRAPLQVGQFESNDELLDKWLTDVYLEGGGGANGGESYLLAWYFAGLFTQHDAMKKRNEKGFLFTIGDEPNLSSFPKNEMENLMGPGNHETLSAEDLLVKASKLYNVYHLHIKETYAGSMNSTIIEWKQKLGDHLIEVDSHEEIPSVIARIVSENSKKAAPVIAAQPETEEKTSTKTRIYGEDDTDVSPKKNLDIDLDYGDII